MMVDWEIAEALADGSIDIKPFDPERLGPASYDLTLAPTILSPSYPMTEWESRIDLRKPVPQDRMNESVLGPDNSYMLRRREFILASTNEFVGLDTTRAARVEGKSSLGRVGMAVHITAGFIDPGFRGQITLEIANLGPWDLELYPGMPIAQVVFERTARAERSYAQTGRYGDQQGPTQSRYGM
jgi:dCTP deaminase